MKTRILLILLLLAGAVSIPASNEDTKLTDRDKEFLSVTRYIITGEEEKLFKSLSQVERPAFIEEFWKKRDPDPKTEENLFKETYFSRIVYANQRYRAGKPGWLTDRGRIFILLGPPDYMNEFPAGITSDDRPSVVWTYDNKLHSELARTMEFIFIDFRGTNDYQLSNTMDLSNASNNPSGTNFIMPTFSGGRRTDMETLANTQKAQKGGEKTLEMDTGSFIASTETLPFKVKLKTGDGISRFLFSVKVRDLSFNKSEEDQTYIGSLDVKIDVVDPSGKSKVLTETFEENFVLDKEAFEGREMHEFTREISLQPGYYQVTVTISDIIGGRGANWVGVISMP